MYYNLYCETPEDDDGGYAEIQDNHSVAGVDSWISGKPLGVKIDEVIRFDVEFVDGYTGPIIEMYRGRVFLMSARLVRALKQAGVDNIECYPAELVNPETGERHNYYGVNIIGVVAAADLQKSKWENFDGEAKVDTFFDKLVLNPDKCRGRLMFRLGESLSTIIVHEKVRAHLLACGMDTLSFLPTDGF
jgi:hypothetical protein